MAQSGGHAGHSHGEENMSDGRLVLAVALNVLLTVAQLSLIHISEPTRPY